MKSKDLLSRVRKTIAEIDGHLERGTFDEGAEGSPSSSDLTVIRQELRRVERELLTATVPPKGQRTLAIGRIILDGWWKCDHEPLAKELMSLSDTYKRKIPATTPNAEWH